MTMDNECSDEDCCGADDFLDLARLDEVAERIRAEARATSPNLTATVCRGVSLRRDGSAVAYLTLSGLDAPAQTLTLTLEPLAVRALVNALKEA